MRAWAGLTPPHAIPITPSTSTLAPHPPSGSLYYFAYGANLSSKTLLRRGIAPSQIKGTPAQVVDPNIALVFGHRGGYATLATMPEKNAKPPGILLRVERALQWQQLPEKNTVTTGADGIVFWKPYGVLYELNEEHLKAIDVREVGYQQTVIDVRILPPHHDGQLSSSAKSPSRDASSCACDSETTLVLESCRELVENDSTYRAVRAVVFVSSPWMLLRHPVLPSQRYRDLIFEGAREKQLPEEYVDWLWQLPAVQASALGGPQYSATLAEVAGKVLGGAALIAISAASAQLM